MRNESILTHITAWTGIIAVMLIGVASSLAQWAGAPIGAVALAVLLSILIVGAAGYLCYQLREMSPLMAGVCGVAVMLLWAAWWPVLWAAGVGPYGPLPWASLPWWLSPWVHWGVPAAAFFSVIVYAWRWRA